MAVPIASIAEIAGAASSASGGQGGGMIQTPHQAAAQTYDTAAGIYTSALSVHEQRQNRRFQRDMSNTAYQRKVADLRAANINPILGAIEGGGAVTPPGSGGNVPPQPSLTASMMNGLNIDMIRAQIADINSARNLKDAQTKDVNMTRDSRINLSIAQKYQAMMSGDLSDEQIQKVRQEIKNLEAQKEQIELENTHSAYDLPRARNESEFHSSPAGKYVPWVKSAKDVSDIVSDYIPKKSVIKHIKR